MKDQFGREIDYVRISVTQRCNFRCVYCGAASAAPSAELSPAAFAAFARAFAAVGVKKIRLTGGEPLVRADLPEIAAAVKEAAAPEILALTTNGYLLEKQAPALLAAGVNAVNVSLDPLNGDCFRAVTGVDGLPAVLRGLEAALSLGFSRVRINAVLLEGVNDREAEALIRLAERWPLDVRFIELMPARGQTGLSGGVPADDLLRRFPFLARVPGTEGTAVYYTAPGFLGKIGFISPVSHKFCGSCNRVRLLSDGRLKPCLGQEDTVDLLPYLGDPEQLEANIRAAIYGKPRGHHMEE